MFFLLGILIATISLIASIVHLGQSANSYYDFVGFTMVLGGTLATAAITFPWQIGEEIRRRLFELIYRPGLDRAELLRACMQVNENLQNNVYRVDSMGKSMAHKILRDGVEMMQLGFTTDKLEPILKERLFQASDRAKQVGLAMRSLAKYPPAFGLAGTVLGLVHLMRGVSDGMSPQETGIRMAIALIATFYGLLVANLLVNPAGESICKHAQEEEKLGEIALQAILLASDKTNLLETQEMLNSFVEDSERIDVIGISRDSEAEAA